MKIYFNEPHSTERGACVYLKVERGTGYLTSGYIRHIYWHMRRKGIRAMYAREYISTLIFMCCNNYVANSYRDAI